jgi:hypothetical protein
MTNEELLTECKKGLNISLTTSAFDGVLTQKILAVKAFMKNAGVDDSNITSELGVGVIVMGVGDLWELKSGEVKFSSAFTTLLTQLTYHEVTTVTT